MSVCVSEGHWIVERVGVEIPTLWILAVGIRRRVWSHEPAHAAGIIAGTEVIETGFCIPFFAGELVNLTGDCSYSPSEFASNTELQKRTP